MGYVYSITNKINGKKYVGESKSKDIATRWNNHKTSMKRKEGATALMGAFEKYGIDNFKFEVLIICFDEDRLHYEIEYIDKLNTLVPNGYNISRGRVDVELIKSKSIKEYIQQRKAKSSEYSMKERSLSVCIRERMLKSEKWLCAVREKRVGNQGKPLTQETKDKIKSGVLRYYNNSRKEHKEIIMKHRDAMARARGSQIVQLSVDNILLGRFISISEAARQTGVPRSSIQANLYGTLKTAGTFIWRYANEDSNIKININKKY